MSEKKLKYEKPVVMDLGVSEGMGDCWNGTLVITPRCRTGGSPKENSSCASGPAALLGCSSGSVPQDCISGAIATFKK